jgi:hypothetical protein
MRLVEEWQAPAVFGALTTTDDFIKTASNAIKLLSLLINTWPTF